MNQVAPLEEIARFLRHIKRGALSLALVWVIWLLAPILTPFVASLMLAWLGDPLVDRLEAAGRSRNTAVLLVFALMIVLITLALLILVPMLQSQVTTLVGALPAMQQWLLEGAIPALEKRLGFTAAEWMDPQRIIDWVRSHWQAAGGAAATVFGYLGRSSFAVVTFVVNLLLTPIVTYYFLRDWDRMVERVAALIPRDHIGTVSKLASESNEVLGAFMRGQFVVMLALGAIYASGMALIGLNLGLLIGMVAGLISFIPYLGATTGVILAVLAALVQAQGVDIKLLAGVAVVFTVGQLLESYVLTPRIVGDKIGLHPVAVIFAVMAGGQLFGFLGMLLALPVAAVANVLLRYAQERYRSSELYAGHSAIIVPAGVGDPPDPLTPVVTEEPKKS
ncbi:AI-2E family transporter [Stenotrophomonas sp. W1S232]|jgi:Predicted permease|uniref:AI-2E family transporter n=1 Tax=Stenotrophomonas koreensis TaxID=266128 RepID=A0A0R0BRF6_9GAMM|nr:AI-2E family transporter [Stenotrophomonas koreensis]KRG59465.1 membrane protein [Stenotrophomonas koreensis]MBB1117076.1 AI-2E family transporter [Stenotrophomonas koreensis]